MGKKRVPIYIVYYCKALKKTGSPIVCITTRTGKEEHLRSLDLKGFDVRMSFNNATGNPKKSGATTVLEVFAK